MIEKKYRKYFIYGYINFENISCSFVKEQEDISFVNRKLRYVFTHIGLHSPKGDYSRWAKVIAVLEIVASILILLGRFVAVFFQKIFSRHIEIQGQYLQAPLTWPAYRVRDMLRSVEGVETHSIKIPFIKNSFKEREIKVLSVVSYKDIFDAFISAMAMVFYMERRFAKEDILFRSYASFEFFLTCRFVKRTESQNKFIYYNTFDRWAFLMCRANTEVYFIQHGKLDYLTTLIRVGTPDVAYYVSPAQQTIVEDTLFTGKPKEVRFRKMLQFTHNDILIRDNGKLNVLIVSVVSFIKDVVQIVEMLGGKVNLYVKPHPGDKVLDSYNHLVEQYGVVILEKTAYPEVDIVLSYNSTLADEYDLAGVRVIRWDLLNNLKEVENLVIENKNNL